FSASPTRTGPPSTCRQARSGRGAALPGAGRLPSSVGRRPTLPGLWSAVESLLHASRDRAQAALDRLRRGRRSTLAELRHLAAKLAIFSDQLRNHVIELRHQISARRAPGACRDDAILASRWTPASTAAARCWMCLLGFFVCHFLSWCAQQKMGAVFPY